MVPVEVRFGHSWKRWVFDVFFTKFMVLITNPKSEFSLVASLVRYSRSKLPKGYYLGFFGVFLAFPCRFQCIKVVLLDAQTYGYMLEFVWSHVDTWYPVVPVEVRFGHSWKRWVFHVFFTKFMVLISNSKSEFTLVASLVRYSRSKLPKGYYLGFFVGF